MPRITRLSGNSPQTAIQLPASKRFRPAASSKCASYDTVFRHAHRPPFHRVNFRTSTQIFRGSPLSVSSKVSLKLRELAREFPENGLAHLVWNLRDKKTPWVSANYPVPARRQLSRARDCRRLGLHLWVFRVLDLYRHRRTLGTRRSYAIPRLCSLFPGSLAGPKGMAAKSDLPRYANHFRRKVISSCGKHEPNLRSIVFPVHRLPVLETRQTKC